jgi:hypothetical protein
MATCQQAQEIPYLQAVVKEILARSCIGKIISILEMSKAIPQIVQNLDIDLSASIQAWSTEYR